MPGSLQERHEVLEAIHVDDDGVPVVDDVWPNPRHGIRLLHGALSLGLRQDGVDRVRVLVVCETLVKTEDRRRCWTHLVRGAIRVFHLCHSFRCSRLSGVVTIDCLKEEAEVWRWNIKHPSASTRPQL